MAAVSGNKGNQNAWGPMKEFLEVVYDFSKDAGAQGALDLFTASADLVVTNCYMKVNTACTSGGSATVAIGKSGDAAGLVAATAVASLGAGKTAVGTTGSRAYKVASGEIPQLTIATADLTAGKITVVFEFSKF
jgi:hypothetical protein